MADTPQLGYGNRDNASIDHVNQMMRSQPWYYEYLKSQGQSPDNVHLNDAQKQGLIRAAQGNGIVVDEGRDGQEIDDSGNFRAKGHKLRNTMIVAGIAAATLATMGAAGVFSAGAGGAGAAVGGAAPAAAGLGGVEGSAVAGLGAASLPGAGTAIGAGSSLAALGATPISALGTLPADAATSGFSTAGAGMSAGGYMTDAAGNVIDAANVPADGGAISTGGKMADLANGLGKLGGSATSLLNNGQDPDLTGIGAANAAAQAARNRILGAQVDQGGPAADKTALANMRTAGLTHDFVNTPKSAFGSPAITINQNTRDLAGQFQAELLKRAQAGKSLTMSGVPDPTPQELADEARARAIANGGSGIPGTAGKLVDGINTGARIAKLAPGVIGGIKDIWSMF